MAVIANTRSRIVVQGIMTPEGMKHTEQALAYGSEIVAGVSDGHGGTSIFDVPVFNTVKEAVRKTKPTISVIYAPPYQAFEEVVQAVKAEIPWIICSTERMPIQDALRLKALLKHSKSQLLGPASQGVITADVCKAGSMPPHLFKAGEVGIVSRSSSLIYEALQQLYEKGLGVTTCVALGAYPVLGTHFKEILKLFQKDNATKVVLMIGEVGSTLEQDVASVYAKMKKRKPLVTYVAGAYVPDKTYMGNIGAIVKTKEQSAEFKKTALKKAGAVIVESPDEMGEAVAEVMAHLKEKGK